MKWLKWLSLLVIGMLTMTMGTVKAYAACSLTATTNGSSVTLSVTGCDPHSIISMHIYVDGGPHQPVKSATNINIDDNGRASITFDSLPIDNYNAFVYKGFDMTAPLDVAYFSITDPVTPLKCGAPCSDGNSPCPSTCGPLQDSATGQWSCTAVGGYTPVPTMPPPIGLVFCDEHKQPTNIPDVNNPKMYTALGCIPVKKENLILWLMGNLFGIVGGITLLLMIYGFIQMSVSKGDPKVVQGAKETITSAITGLVVCIFALFLLNLLGRGILKIPGF